MEISLATINRSNKIPSKKSLSRSNNPSPPRSLQPHPKSYHSSKHSEAEEPNINFPEKPQNSFFSSVSSLPQSPSDPSSSSNFLASNSHTAKKSDSSQVLITEVAEVSKLNIKSFNVSWADSLTNSSNTGSRKCFRLANSLNSSILDHRRPFRYPIEKVAKLKIDLESIVIIEQNESPSASPTRALTSIRQNLNLSIINSAKCEVIGFYDAIIKYNLIETSSLIRKKLWKNSFFQRICCCVQVNELDEQPQEVCEKLVRFAYSPVDLAQVFHKNLIISACVRVFRIEDVPEDPEIILEGLLERIRFSSDVMLLGFLNVLFLECFFGDVLEKIEEVCIKQKIEVLELVCKLSKINLRMIRTRKMNRVIAGGDKCLEVIFFVFAGICLYYVELVQIHRSKRGILGKLQQLIKDRLEDVLDVAKKAYSDQATLV